MKKVLLVTTASVYEEDISFFYQLILCKNYREATEALEKEEYIELAILEEGQGTEEFLDYTSKYYNSDVKIMVFLKDRSVKNMRAYFKKGVFDVSEDRFNPLNIFYYLDRMENEKPSSVYVKKLEKRVQELTDEISDYRILYETTKVLRLPLSFKKVMERIIELIENIILGKVLFILNHNYYYSAKSEWDKLMLLKKALRHYKVESLGELSKLIPGYVPLQIDGNTIYNFPIIIKNQLKGNILILLNKGELLQDRQIELINNILSQSGIVIENAFLITEGEKRNIDIVKSLVKAIEAKDYYTKGHSDRVAVLSVLIAERMTLPDAKLTEIEMAAVLHDVGKIGLSENILNKEGKLTDAEYKLIKEHPQKGYDIVSQIHNMQNVANIIKYHHERWDGFGYPSALSGSKIPIESRIIAVADTYDAITSDRPYRKGKSHEYAIREIEKNKEVQFDPTIADIFLKIDEKLLK